MRGSSRARKIGAALVVFSCVLATGAAAAPSPSGHSVAPRPYALDNPAGVLPTPEGAVLVAERGTRNRILRVNPDTGAFTTFARGVPAPFALAYDAAGSLLVSSTSGLFRIGRDRKPVRISDHGVSPFAVLPDGAIVFAHELSVGIIPSGGGAPRLLRAQVGFAHGLVLLPDGRVAISDTGNGRLLRVDLGSGAATVLTRAVKTPMGLALEPTGSLLVVDFDRGRVARVSPSGASRTVAKGLKRPYGLARVPSGAMFVTEVGEVTRATGGLARISRAGRVTRVRLTPH